MYQAESNAMTPTFGARHSHKVHDAWMAAEVIAFTTAMSGAELTAFNGYASIDDVTDAIAAKCVDRKCLELAWAGRPLS